jgi:hypothetical protein
MLPLEPTLAAKLQAGYKRSQTAQLTVVPVLTSIDGASYKVNSEHSTHFVYIAKSNGEPTYHCDCLAHERGLVCRCGALALWEYKNWLRANSPVCSECDVLPVTLANTDLCNNCIAEVA